MTIKKLREQIDCIDEDLLILIEKRQKLAKQIGVLKEKNFLPLEDSLREKEVLEKNLKKGKTLGLLPCFVRSLVGLIILNARIAQGD